MTTTEIMITVLTSSAFTGLLVEIIRSIRRFIDRRQNKGLARIENDITELKSTVYANNSSIHEIQEELAHQRETDLVLLHDRIWDIFNTLKHQEYVDIEDKANLEYLFEEYKNNKGNHRAELMFSVIENKPVAVKKGSKNDPSKSTS